MNKTAFKTFVYSFVFTSFAIFGANELISRDKNERDIKIPHQNIALFLKKEPMPGAVGIQPVKKIELIKTAAAAEFSHSKPEEPIVLAKEIPTIKKDVKIATSKKRPASKAKNSRKEIIIAQLEDVELPPFVPAKKIKKEKRATPVLKKKTNPSSVALPPEIATAVSQGQPKELVLANARQEQKLPSNTSDIDNDVLLIPLEKDGAKPLLASEKIKINGEEAEQQVAMLNFDKPINSIVKDTKKENSSKEEKTDNWQTMAQKNGTNNTLERPKKDIYNVTPVDVPEQESPWVAAQGAKFPKNNSIKEKDYYKTGQDAEKVSEIMNGDENKEKNEVKVASEVVKNLLIPIPEDILNNKNLTPQLVSDPKNKKLEERIIREETSRQADIKPETDEIPFITEEMDSEEEEFIAQPKEEGGIFKSLSSIFSPKANTQKDKETEKKEIVTIAKKRTENKKNDISEEKNVSKNVENRILPTEIRLSFQTNRAEISGKTLSWIQAFAKKTMESDYTILEVRIDGTSSYNLQQKRLNLLYNILTNLGLDYDKVNTVFTNREPNSFVLRTVKTKEDSDKKQFDPASVYYRRW